MEVGCISGLNRQAANSNPTCSVSIPLNGTSYTTSLSLEGALPASGANCSQTGNENPQRDMLELLAASQLGSTAQATLINGGTSSLYISDTAFSTYEGGILSVIDLPRQATSLIRLKW
jgi:hypothetical protein